MKQPKEFFTTFFKNLTNTGRTFGYIISLSWRYDRLYLLCFLPLVLVNAVSPFVGVVFPKLILDAIVAQSAPERIVALAAAMFISRAVLSVISQTFGNISGRRILNIRTKMKLALLDRTMKLEYPFLENPEYMNMKERASQCIDNNYDIGGIAATVSSFFSNILTLAGLLYVIARVQILMIVLILLITGVNALAKSHQAGRTYFFRKNFSTVARKLFHMLNVTWDYKYAKDIKTYRLREWLNAKKQAYLESISGNNKRVFALAARIDLLAITLSAVQELALYLCGGKRRGKDDLC